jgi:hypothetical protein
MLVRSLPTTRPITTTRTIRPVIPGRPPVATRRSPGEIDQVRLLPSRSGRQHAARRRRKDRDQYGDADMKAAGARASPCCEVRKVGM